MRTKPVIFTKEQHIHLESVQLEHKNTNNIRCSWFQCGGCGGEHFDGDCGNRYAYFYQYHHHHQQQQQYNRNNFHNQQQHQYPQ